MKTLYVIFTTLLVANFYGQEPQIEWSKCYGGSGSDRARCIQQTPDGGFIIAGESNLNNGDIIDNKGDYDCWILKIDEHGNIQWQKSLGGDKKDVAYSIGITNDEGYIMAGATKSSNGDVASNFGDLDFWVVKLTSEGNIQWEKSLGGSGKDEAKSIHQTTDGGYIVAGYTESSNGHISLNHGESDYWVVKLDTIGNIEWQKTYGGSNTDEANSIQQTADGGYIVAGSTRSDDWDVENSHYKWDLWILKLDATGEIEWQINAGGDDIDKAHDAKQTPDGGYIIVGEIESYSGDITGNHGLSDCVVIKLDHGGNMEWYKAFGGTNWDRCQCVEPTPSGGYIIAGSTASYNGDLSESHGGYDYWVMELSPLGEILWQKSLGGTGDDKAYCVAKTLEGGFAVCGESNSNNGNVNDNHGNQDFWIVKFSNLFIGFESIGEIKPHLFPNPASEFITIKEIAPTTPITITNLQGKVFYRNIAHNEIETIDVSKLPSGMYFLNSQKFVKK